MFDANHYITLSVHDGIDGCRTEPAGKDTVVGSRASTTLQMPKDSDTYVVLRIFILHALCKVHGSACQFAFCNNYNTTVLRFAETVFDELFQLIDFRAELRNDSGFCTRCDGTIQSKKTGITSHYFHKEQTFVRSCCITNFVHCIQNGIQSCIIADSCICSVQVIINCTR